MQKAGPVADTRYLALGDVVADELFPDLDLALRRGRHIDREDTLWYTFLVDAQALLEAFYRRFGCELIHPADGYFYLLPTGDKLGRRHLSVPEMLVGQALTHKSQRMQRESLTNSIMTHSAAEAAPSSAWLTGPRFGGVAVGRSLASISAPSGRT